jgi:crotonobetainyl-CoA:carnitine CoA-transferase CaiB-like acyl-CoA transferase
LDAVFATRTLDQWGAVFDAYDVWFAPVLTPPEVAVDPQALAAGAFVDVPGGEFSAAHRSVATPVTFSAETVGPRGPTPALGQHTDEVLAELNATSRRS